MTLQRAIITIAGEPEGAWLTQHTPKSAELLRYLADTARRNGMEDGRLMPIAEDVAFYLTARQCKSAINLAKARRGLSLTRCLERAVA